MTDSQTLASKRCVMGPPARGGHAQLRQRPQRAAGLLRHHSLLTERHQHQLLQRRLLLCDQLAVGAVLADAAWEGAGACMGCRAT